jgi:hypothetical protein
MKVYFNQMDIVDRDSQGDPEHVDTELYYQIGKVVYIYSERFSDFTGVTSGPHTTEDWKEISVNDIVSKQDLIKFIIEESIR